MSSSSGAMAFLKRDVGPVTVVQILTMLLAVVIGLAVFDIDNMGRSLIAWLVVGIMAYMLPHLFGATVHVKAVWGVVFALIMVLFGGLAIGPSYVEENSDGSTGGSDYFGDAQYTFADDGTVTVTVPVTKTPGEGETAYLMYSDVTMVAFKSVYTPHDFDYVPLTIDGGTGTATAHVDTDKLWFFLVMVGTGDDRDPVDGSMTDATLSGDVYKGSMQVYVLGAFMCMVYTLVVYYVILIFSSLIRRMIRGKRQSMEDQGRLYPQGYGRCEKCGSIVLPGEVQCRKCGAYIERPESMRPHKVDYFECSNCGAEVPADAKVCPKCGASFEDEVENEVEHADGTVDVSETSVKCPGCGAEIPSNSRICPKCGRRLRSSSTNPLMCQTSPFGGHVRFFPSESDKRHYRRLFSSEYVVKYLC